MLLTGLLHPILVTMTKKVGLANPNGEGNYIEVIPGEQGLWGFNSKGVAGIGRWCKSSCGLSDERESPARSWGSNRCTEQGEEHYRNGKQELLRASFAVCQLSPNIATCCQSAIKFADPSWQCACCTNGHSHAARLQAVMVLDPQERERDVVHLQPFNKTAQMCQGTMLASKGASSFLPDSGQHALVSYHSSTYIPNPTSLSVCLSYKALADKPEGWCTMHSLFVFTCCSRPLHKRQKRACLFWGGGKAR